MGEISKHEYDLAAEVLDNRLMKVEKKLAKLREISTTEESKESYERIKTQLQQCMEFNEITREIVNRFVDKIIVYEDERIEIHYKFSIGN